MLLPNNDLKNLAKRAGLHEDPRIKPLINHPNLPKDKRYVLQKYLTAVAARRCPEPHPYLPPPSREEAGSGIAEVGRVVTGRGPEYPARLKEENFLTHIKISGSTGAGKTLMLTHIGHQVHNSGRAVWWFDTEIDVTKYVVALMPDVLVLSQKDLRLTLFDGPSVEGLEWEEYLNKLLDTWRGELYCRDGIINLARSTAIELRDKKGSFTIYDFHEASLKRKYVMRSRETDYFVSLRNRLEGMLLPFLGVTYGSGSHDIRALMKKSIVWRLQGLSEDLLGFFITVLLLWVSLSSIVSSSPVLNLLLVFDEFTRICNRERLKRSDIGENLLVDFMRTCRKRGVGIMLATQTPQVLPGEVLSLCNTWAVMKPADGRFLGCVSQGLGLDRDQEDYLMQLPDRDPRRVVVRCPGIAGPFLVEIPKL